MVEENPEKRPIKNNIEVYNSIYGDNAEFIYIPSNITVDSGSTNSIDPYFGIVQQEDTFAKEVVKLDKIIDLIDFEELNSFIKNNLSPEMIENLKSMIIKTDELKEFTEDKFNFNRFEGIKDTENVEIYKEELSQLYDNVCKIHESQVSINENVKIDIEALDNYYQFLLLIIENVYLFIENINAEIKIHNDCLESNLIWAKLGDGDDHHWHDDISDSENPEEQILMTVNATKVQYQF